MLWAQISVSFLVWIALGWLARGGLARWGRSLRVSRGAIVALGAGLFVVGLIVLAAGLFAVAVALGPVRGGLPIWAWGAITFVGAAFVLLQAAGAACMLASISVRETSAPADSSDPREE